MKTLLSSGIPLSALILVTYLLGYKTETRREIREIHDSRFKDIYYYTLRK